MKKVKITLIALIFCTVTVFAQNTSVKTNLPMDATLSINAGIESRLSSRWTFDLSGSFNPWTLNGNRKWKHWMVQPELRYWTCESFNGWFMALHAQGGAYNFSRLPFSILDDGRYEGWFVGAGLGLGYQWILSRRISLEVEAGFGYNYTRYDRYQCETCGRKIEDDKPYHYVGPTKASIGIIYFF